MAPTLELNPKLSIVETTVAISHDLIRNEQLHLGLLALSETCLKTVQCLSADTHGEPRKLSVLHVHQDAQWLEGASLLSTDRPTLGVSAHPQLFSKDRLAKCARPYTFSCEVQLVRLGSASSSMTIAIIYRNPYPMGDFYEDLATLISSVSRLVKDYCSVET